MATDFGKHVLPDLVNLNEKIQDEVLTSVIHTRRSINILYEIIIR